MLTKNGIPDCLLYPRRREESAVIGPGHGHVNTETWIRLKFLQPILGHIVAENCCSCTLIVRLQGLELCLSVVAVHICSIRTFVIMLRASV